MYTTLGNKWYALTDHSFPMCHFQHDGFNLLFFFLQEEELRKACHLGLLAKIADLLEYVSVDAADAVSLK